MQVGRPETDQTGKPEHLVFEHFAFDVVLGIGDHVQPGLRTRPGEQQIAETVIADTVIRLRVPEDVADRVSGDL